MWSKKFFNVFTIKSYQNFLQCFYTKIVTPKIFNFFTPKMATKLFFRTFCTKMTTKDFFNFFNLRWPLKTHCIFNIFIDFFFKKFIDFLLLFFNFLSQKRYWFFLIFLYAFLFSKKIASQQIKKNIIWQQEKRWDQSP